MSLGLAITADQVGDMLARNTIANASTLPNRSMLGVEQTSAIEWALQGAGLVMTGAGLRASVKGAKKAEELAQLESELAKLHGPRAGEMPAGGAAQAALESMSPSGSTSIE